MSSQIIERNICQNDLKLLIDEFSVKRQFKHTDWYQLDGEGYNKTVF